MMQAENEFFVREAMEAERRDQRMNMQRRSSEGDSMSWLELPDPTGVG